MIPWKRLLILHSLHSSHVVALEFVYIWVCSSYRKSGSEDDVAEELWANSRDSAASDMATDHRDWAQSVHPRSLLFVLQFLIYYTYWHLVNTNLNVSFIKSSLITLLTTVNRIFMFVVICTQLVKEVIIFMRSLVKESYSYRSLYARV